ncbi:hypothetical protein K502DRAFT_367088 [Neoconidiobolus thromboides FSU 785]|nr:hypothetical protein K502DRAFT_367088 [Neoconidiobolus thromboides FSU 785]
MLNHPIRVYLITTLQHTLALGFTYVSLIFPNWLVFRAPEPLGFRTTYGLFQKCSIITNHCRPFPDEVQGDCNEEGFCRLWYTARYTQLFATILGTITLFFFLFILFSDARKQYKAWPLALGASAAYTVLQLVSFSSIAYLFNNSAEFYIGTNYDFSFYLNLASWLLSVIGGAVILVSFPFRANGYQEIN